MRVFGLSLDLTITLGNVVSAGVTVCGIILAYAALRERLVALETMIKPIWEWWNKERGE